MAVKVWHSAVTVVRSQTAHAQKTLRGIPVSTHEQLLDGRGEAGHQVLVPSWDEVHVFRVLDRAGGVVSSTLCLHPAVEVVGGNAVRLHDLSKQ